MSPRATKHEACLWQLADPFDIEVYRNGCIVLIVQDVVCTSWELLSLTQCLRFSLS